MHLKNRISHFKISLYKAYFKKKKEDEIVQ